jgi:hypothetical protein
MVPKMKKLVRESEWLKVYSTDTGVQYESKLLLDDVPVSARSVIRRWDRFSQEEKWEFVLALQARAKLEPDDVPLLDFLMEVGDPVIRSTLAPLLPMHPRKEAAVVFLLAQINRETSNRANYFQALELIGDIGAVPTLTNIYEEMQRVNGSDYASWSAEQALDFVACSRALWRLNGAERFRLSIEGVRSHPNRTVSAFALLALGRG